MKYDAFISYSHADCGNIAPEIQRALENIGKPWYKLKRVLTVFRDETNLTASPELWNSIVTALENSDNFILLASPIAKDSHWVNKEVEHWFSKERKGDLFIVLVDGNIVWDYSKNDFNFEKTNCIPKAIIGKFKSEPLWIDLSEYINVGQKSINYKQAGFTSSLTKIIGGMVGKPPREIESDELSRKRKTTFALFTSSLVFITLLLSGIFLYNLNKSNQKNSDSNRLIALGNDYRETNINKALILYAYAFEKNNDPNSFKLLKSFYDENTLYRYEVYDYETEKNKEITDTVNVFYRKIKSKELPIDPTAHSDNYQFPTVYLNTATNTYFKLNKNAINIYSLSTSNFKSINFPFGKIMQIINNPNSETIYILSNNPAYLLSSYNLRTNKFSTILTNQMIKNETFLESLNFSKDDDLFNAHLTNSALYTNLILYSNFFNANSSTVWLTYNINSKKVSYFDPIKNKEWLTYSHSYESINYFEQDSTVFFNIREHNDIQGCKTIYGSTQGNFFNIIYDGDVYSNNLFQQPTVSTYSRRLIYGNFGGNIITYFSENELLLQRPLKFPNTVTAITTSEKYIFVGADKGVFHIFINKFEDCVACLAGGHYSIRSVKLPSDSPITNMYYFMEQLYLINLEGEIYKINVSQYSKLKTNPKQLLNQLIVKLGFENLTKQEKIKLKIIE